MISKRTSPGDNHQATTAADVPERKYPETKQNVKSQHKKLKFKTSSLLNGSKRFCKKTISTIAHHCIAAAAFALVVPPHFFLLP